MTSDISQAELFPKVGPYSTQAPNFDWNPQFMEQLFHEYLGSGIHRQYLLQYLVIIQHHFGSINPSALRWLSDKIKISNADIRAVIEFYSFLSTGTPPSFHVLFASNIIEEHHNLRELFDHVKQTLEDSRASIKLTSCIGLSDQPLSALVNGYAISNINPQNVDELCSLIQNETPLNQWPQEWFNLHTQLKYSGPLLDYPYLQGKAFANALAMSKEGIIAEIEKSGLRGLGGAGFPTGIKWKSCANQPSDTKFVICNADEGEPGTFKDRYFLIHHLDRVIEGMAIAARAVGAHKGYIYLRGEYLSLFQTIYNYLKQTSRNNSFGNGFHIELHLGAGAYVCGEETALIESIEGKRGIPRSKPPFPGEKGLFQAPSIINNVETFACVTQILHQGADDFIQFGSNQSKGSRLLSVSGDCNKPGLYNLPFGTTLRELIQLCEAENVQCVQVGGPSGNLFFADEIDGPFDFDNKGSGGSVMIFNHNRSLHQIAQNFMHFFHHESCGFCTPCRVGTQVLPNLLANYYNDPILSSHLKNDLEQTSELMSTTSHCGLGKTASRPVMHYLRGLSRND